MSEAAKVQGDEPQAIYDHCYGHTLNLVFQNNVFNSTLDIVYKI